MKSGGNISGFKESGGAIQHVMTIRLVGPPLDELAVVGGLLDDTGRVDGKRVIAPHAKRMVDMGGIHNCSCWVLFCEWFARQERATFVLQRCPHTQTPNLQSVLPPYNMSPPQQLHAFLVVEQLRV